MFGISVGGKCGCGCSCSCRLLLGCGCDCGWLCPCCGVLVLVVLGLGDPAIKMTPATIIHTVSAPQPTQTPSVTVVA